MFLRHNRRSLREGAARVELMRRGLLQTPFGGAAFSDGNEPARCLLVPECTLTNPYHSGRFEKVDVARESRFPATQVKKYAATYEKFHALGTIATPPS